MRKKIICIFLCVNIFSFSFFKIKTYAAALTLTGIAALTLELVGGYVAAVNIWDLCKDDVEKFNAQKALEQKILEDKNLQLEVQRRVNVSDGKINFSEKNMSELMGMFEHHLVANKALQCGVDVKNGYISDNQLSILFNFYNKSCSPIKMTITCKSYHTMRVLTRASQGKMWDYVDGTGPHVFHLIYFSSPEVNQGWKFGVVIDNNNELAYAGYDSSYYPDYSKFDNLTNIPYLPLSNGINIDKSITKDNLLGLCGDYSLELGRSICPDIKNETLLKELQKIKSVCIPTVYNPSIDDTYVAEKESAKVIDIDKEIAKTDTSEIDMSIPDNVVLDFSPLYADLSKKFPFCIPWDIFRFLGSWVGDSKAPRWTGELDFGFLGKVPYDIDFTKFDTIAKITRYMELIGFIFFLMVKSKDLINK